MECKIIVDYSRPECGHIVRVHCVNKKKLSNGYRLEGECKQIVSDFIHPVCNHRIKEPTCATKQSYELNTPNCLEKVLHKSKCGCETWMQCYESIQETAKPSICTKSIDVARPRCGHMLSMRCFEAKKWIQDWTKHAGKSAINSKLLWLSYSFNYPNGF